MWPLAWLVEDLLGSSCVLPASSLCKAQWRGNTGQRFCILPFRYVWLLGYSKPTKEILEPIHSGPVFTVMNIASHRGRAMKTRLQRWCTTHCTALWFSATFTFNLLESWECLNHGWYFASAALTPMWPCKETWTFPKGSIHSFTCMLLQEVFYPHILQNMISLWL